MIVAPLRDVLVVSACDNNEYDRWRRLGMFTEKRPRRSGVQVLTLTGALELAFTVALMRCGFRLAEAKSEVRRWLAEYDAGKLARWWAANPNSSRRKISARYGTIALGRGFNAPETVETLGATMPNNVEAGWVGDDAKGRAPPAVVVVSIDRAEIIRHMTALFESYALSTAKRAA